MAVTQCLLHSQEKTLTPIIAKVGLIVKQKPLLKRLLFSKKRQEINLNQAIA